MLDTTLVHLAVAVLALAAVTAVVALAGIAVVLRDLWSTEIPVVVTVTPAADLDVRSAA